MWYVRSAVESFLSASYATSSFCAPSSNRARIICFRRSSSLLPHSVYIAALCIRRSRLRWVTVDWGSNKYERLRM